MNQNIGSIIEYVFEIKEIKFFLNLYFNESKNITHNFFQHPITRFLARYIYSNPQKDYEKVLHYIDDESKIIEIRKLEDKVWRLQAERQDYKYNHFLPYDNTASRDFREFLKRDRDNIDY